MAAALAQHLGAHAIAVQCILGLANWNEEITFAGGMIRHHKSEAARVELELSFDFFLVARQPELSIRPHFEAAFGSQPFNSTCKRLGVVSADTHLLPRLVDVDGAIVVIGQMVFNALDESEWHAARLLARSSADHAVLNCHRTLDPIYRDSSREAQNYCVGAGWHREHFPRLDLHGPDALH